MPTFEQRRNKRKGTSREMKKTREKGRGGGGERRKIVKL